jgi:hypothetical protein
VVKYGVLSMHPTSTVGYMFDSADANILNIVAPLIFKLAILYENIIFMKKFFELKKNWGVAISFI